MDQAEHGNKRQLIETQANNTPSDYPMRYPVTAYCLRRVTLHSTSNTKGTIAMPEQSTAKKSKLMVLKQYFELQPGQTLKEFAQELKQLSTNELLELATLAADDMGIPAEQRTFGTEDKIQAAA
ncbi:hypothetical protein OAS39_07925 [Pirellulales bacterium]|nr:hypothetical protein [Pirellulales bacterium]